MSKTIAEAITEIQQSISSKEEEVNAMKRQVNILCGIDGQQPIYSDLPAEGSTSPKSRVLKLKPDEFRGDNLNKAMRRYLELRKEAMPETAPAKSEDIAKALIEGGFDFKGKDSQGSVATSLGKSSHTFARFESSGLFGLQAWYGIKPKRKTGAATETNDEDEAEDDVDAGGQGLPYDASKEGGDKK